MTSTCKFAKLIVRRGRGGHMPALPPFQRASPRSISSLHGLYQELKSSHPYLRYIMTASVDQGRMENMFSQMRSMCGPNTHPGAVETQRLRKLLMASSSLSNVCLCIGVLWRGNCLGHEPITHVKLQRSGIYSREFYVQDVREKIARLDPYRIISKPMARSDIPCDVPSVYGYSCVADSSTAQARP